MKLGKIVEKDPELQEIPNDNMIKTETMEPTSKITDFDEGITFILKKMEEEGEKFDPGKYPDILKLNNKFGTTVAYIMVQSGYMFDPDKHKDILKLKDKYNVTIAHKMAREGYKFDSEKHKNILELTDDSGITVADIMKAHKKNLTSSEPKKEESKEESKNFIQEIEPFEETHIDEEYLYLNINDIKPEWGIDIDQLNLKEESTGCFKIKHEDIPKNWNISGIIQDLGRRQNKKKDEQNNLSDTLHESPSFSPNSMPAPSSGQGRPVNKLQANTHSALEALVAGTLGAASGAVSGIISGAKIGTKEFKEKLNHWREEQQIKNDKQAEKIITEHQEKIKEVNQYIDETLNTPEMQNIIKETLAKKGDTEITEENAADIRKNVHEFIQDKKKSKTPLVKNYLALQESMKSMLNNNDIDDRSKISRGSESIKEMAKALQEDSIKMASRKDLACLPDQEGKALQKKMQEIAERIINTLKRFFDKILFRDTENMTIKEEELHP